MADTHRKQRHIARLRRLMDVAIAERQVNAGVGISKQICLLEGWTTPKDEPQEPTPTPPDLSHLVNSLTTQAS